MSASVLFAWELGDGLGHVSRLLRIAERLRDTGVRCRFAVRQLELAGGVVRKAGFDVLQAPLARIDPIRGPDGNQPASVGDILGAIGFADAERLATLVAGWQSLIDMAAPDLVVTDYAPTANLALFGGTVPWVPIGDGFSLPPFETHGFVPFRNVRPAYEEARMLAAVRAVQAERGRPPPARLPLLFEGRARFVITLPELDPWGKLRSAGAIGPVDPPPRPVSGTPTEDYFAYLSASYAYIERVLEGLTRSGKTGSIFLRDATAEQRAAWRDRGLTIWDRPQDLRAMAERAGIIVHHGGIGTAVQALGFGRPQVLIPRHFEQMANAQGLGQLGVAAALRGGGNFSADDVGRAIGAAGTDRPRRRASDVATILANRPANALETVRSACMGLLSS